MLTDSSCSSSWRHSRHRAQDPWHNAGTADNYRSDTRRTTDDMSERPPTLASCRSISTMEERSGVVDSATRWKLVTRGHLGNARRPAPSFQGTWLHPCGRANRVGKAHVLSMRVRGLHGLGVSFEECIER